MPDTPRQSEPHRLRVTTAPQEIVPASAGPQADLVATVAREVMAGLKADPLPQAGSVQPPPRSRDAVLVVLAIAGALLWQRGETTREEMQEHARAQAATAAAQSARLDAFEAAAAIAQAQARRHENTLRETLFILGEDSRAEWDALAQIHAATKPAGAPALRQPATAQRLQALREAMAVDRQP